MWSNICVRSKTKSIISWFCWYIAISAISVESISEWRKMPGIIFGIVPTTNKQLAAEVLEQCWNHRNELLSSTHTHHRFLEEVYIFKTQRYTLKLNCITQAESLDEGNIYLYETISLICSSSSPSGNCD